MKRFCSRALARFVRLAAGLCALGAAATTACAQSEQPIRPEAAFPYTVIAEADRLLVQFDVRDGYYLYKEKFGFDSATPGVSFGAASFPAGLTHTDEFFGEQTIFRGNFEIEVPYRRTGAVTDLDLTMRLQGCADYGLCYPPQTWEASTTLPDAPLVSDEVGAAAGATRAAGTAGTARRAPSLLAGPASEILPPDEVFSMTARFDGANELTVGWHIEPGHYLYRDALRVEVDGDIQIGAVTWPRGEPHYDENYQDTEVFFDYVETSIPFSRATPNEMPVVVRAAYQGCRENSVCYLPSEQTMALTLPASSTFPVPADGPSSAAFTGAGGSAAGAGGSSGATAPRVSEQDRLSSLILDGSWLMIGGTFFGFGLLLAFTPCVLPMVPILSGLIAGQGAQVSTGRAFALSLSYVLGMAVTYTAAGVLAALAGEQIQAIFQKPWIITVFAGLFVVLALSMFGLFNVQMPAAIQTRVANLANRQKAGTFIGTAVIGALSALIVTTCVAPPLVAALAVIGQSGDPVKGGGALFALSMGMGAPLLLVGASAGKLLPKVGPWMSTVKAAFGVAMLGLAIWMLERVLPGTFVLVLWSLLVFLTGVFLGAFEPLPAQPSPARRLAKGFGVLACLYGAMLLIGATLGGDNPLRPIPRGVVSSGVMANDSGPQFQPIRTVAELDGALAAARAAGQPVMVDFTADWCATCKELERYTFPTPVVTAALAPFVLLKADVTDNTPDDKALLERFGAFGPPTIAFFDTAGRAQDGYTLVGFVPADEFARHVTELAAL